MVARRRYTLADGITQSMLQDWMACRVRSRNVLQLWESGIEREALAFGSLFHGILERYYDCRINGEEFDYEAWERKWRKKHAPRAKDAQVLERHLAMASVMFAEYKKHWKKSDDDKTWVIMEGIFDSQWNGFRLRGRRDGIFRDRKKFPWLLETKTASGLADDTIEAKLALDFQNLFYITTYEAETGERLAGVLYNIAVKPGHKLLPKETSRDYMDKIEAAIRENPKKYFHRFEAAYTERQKAEFREELKWILDAFAEWLESGMTKDTWKNRGSCITKWTCEFLGACSQGKMSGYKQTRELFRELKD